jgi:KipI family sensor histidine kinase inhibitor
MSGVSLAPEPRVTWCGEEYLIAHLSANFGLYSAASALRLQHAVEQTELGEAIIDSIPGWCSLLLRFDSRLPVTDDAEEIVLGVIAAAEKQTVEFESRLITLPVSYGDDFGPDLDFVAQANEMSVREAVERLQEVQFAGMVSFTPGMANCMWLDSKNALSAPKYSSPRTYTPLGTVGLGGSSIALYSVPSPGGFQMVGRLAVPVYSPDPVLPPFEKSPTLISPGDRLVLASVDAEEFEEIGNAVAEGHYEFDIQPGRCRLDGKDLSWT